MCWVSRPSCRKKCATGGERRWALADPVWGIWELPDAGIELLPAELSGRDAIELGCGTGYVSAWMARRGARVVGIDNSAQQLATARRLAAAHGVELTLVHGDAEAVDHPDASFDFAVSEYGAAIWCDPYRWIPEAHRLLRPGGMLLVTFHVGSEVEHLDVWWEKSVDLDFAFYQPGEVEEWLEEAGFELEETLLREPNPEVEVATRRAYLFARKPLG